MRKRCDDFAAGQGPDGRVETNRPPLGERWRRPTMLLPILLLIGGAVRYLAGQCCVVTDDAFVRAARDSINAWVSGAFERRLASRNAQ